MSVDALELVPPGVGRRFTASNIVRLSDAMPGGAARLDSIGRYLQDIAADDGNDAGINLEAAWVVRRSIIEVARRPMLDEIIELATWASGAGARWAARRTTIAAAGLPIIEAVSLWVCLDPATLRPARLPAQFWTSYGDAVAGRSVSPRLCHPDPPAALVATARPWPLRFSDLDVMDHVNNTVTWAAVEDELDRIAPGTTVHRAELEYREPIERSHGLRLISRREGGAISMWLVAEVRILASAVLLLE